MRRWSCWSPIHHHHCRRLTMPSVIAERASLGWLLGSAENFQSLLEIGAAADDGGRVLSVDERAAALERSADRFEKMGRPEDATAMRRAAAEIRAARPANDQTQDGG